MLNDYRVWSKGQIDDEDGETKDDDDNNGGEAKDEDDNDDDIYFHLQKNGLVFIAVDEVRVDDGGDGDGSQGSDDDAHARQSDVAPAGVRQTGSEEAPTDVGQRHVGIGDHLAGHAWIRMTWDGEEEKKGG